MFNFIIYVKNAKKLGCKPEEASSVSEVMTSVLEEKKVAIKIYPY